MKKVGLGRVGELLAAKYLESKGYEIIATNFRHGRNEIDIIAQLDSFLIFVEVKSRSNLNYGYPEEMVTGDQEERIRNAAEIFVERNKWRGNIRFDIVAVYRNKETDIHHIHDAF